MNIAFIGCGFVADFYMVTLSNYPNLKVSGVFDQDHERTDRFAKYYSVHKYKSLDEILNDQSIQIILNLTNPGSHYEITKVSLEAGKHVYSEKPLAMNLEEAKELVQIAEKKTLYLSSAPCSVLSESAQTIWKSLQQNKIGSVRLVYAELDDGLVHKMRYRNWVSQSGKPWPYKYEFEVG